MEELGGRAKSTFASENGSYRKANVGEGKGRFSSSSFSFASPHLPFPPSRRPLLEAEEEAEEGEEKTAFQPERPPSLGLSSSPFSKMKMEKRSH